ncbi:MAG: RNA polymerase-binding protein DksA [Alphaproteobacteria bacterium]|nr:RNA polymerase-binding protein DksA [Alphaproteobacteria bacterium]
MTEKICELPTGYVPSEDEEFMNDFQREYFRRKLESWRDELLKESDAVLKQLQDEDKTTFTDIADYATAETDLGYELRSKERARKLIAKIDSSLQRIKDRTYGFCEKTGEPISLKRLEARPVATLSIVAQEKHERDEKLKKD